MTEPTDERKAEAYLQVAEMREQARREIDRAFDGLCPTIDELLGEDPGPLPHEEHIALRAKVLDRMDDMETAYGLVKDAGQDMNGAAVFRQTAALFADIRELLGAPKE